LAQLFGVEVHLDEEHITDFNRENEEDISLAPDKPRGRPRKRKAGARIAKSASNTGDSATDMTNGVLATTDAEESIVVARKVDAETPETDVEVLNVDAETRKAGPTKTARPPPDNSVESISEILRAAPRVR
jgi:hypothetical protein